MIYEDKLFNPFSKEILSTFFDNIRTRKTILQSQMRTPLFFFPKSQIKSCVFKGNVLNFTVAD